VAEDDGEVAEDELPDPVVLRSEAEEAVDGLPGEDCALTPSGSNNAAARRQEEGTDFMGITNQGF